MVERARLGDHNPRHPRDFGGERNGDLIDVHPRLKTVKPPAKSVTGPIQMRHARARPMDKQLSNVAVAVLADAEEPLFAAG